MSVCFPTTPLIPVNAVSRTLFDPQARALHPFCNIKMIKLLQEYLRSMSDFDPSDTLGTSKAHHTLRAFSPTLKSHWGSCGCSRGSPRLLEGSWTILSHPPADGREHHFLILVGPDNVHLLQQATSSWRMAISAPAAARSGSPSAASFVWPGLEAPLSRRLVS